MPGESWSVYSPSKSHRKGRLSVTRLQTSGRFLRIPAGRSAPPMSSSTTSNNGSPQRRARHDRQSRRDSVHWPRPSSVRDSTICIRSGCDSTNGFDNGRWKSWGTPRPQLLQTELFDPAVQEIPASKNSRSGRPLPIPRSDSRRSRPTQPRRCGHGARPMGSCESIASACLRSKPAWPWGHLRSSRSES